MNLYLQMGSNNFHETRHNDSINARPSIRTKVDYENYERDVTEVLSAISRVPFWCDPDFSLPEPGERVQRVEWRDNGRYYLGQRKIACPVRCMYIRCARRKVTAQFFTMKVLNLKNDEEEVLTQDDIQGMFLMHNEYMLLHRLRDKDGVYRVHEYFKELYAEEELNEHNVLIYSGRVRVRVCLVLDYVAPSDVNPPCVLENLQSYVLSRKVLTELEATKILREILLVLKVLHSNNIVHRDLKLGNIRVDRTTLKATLINLGFGQFLPSISTMISDQRGSPAYISPDVLSGKPYAPKPSDIWSLGICYYVMLMGAFPFYDTKSSVLFNKIIRGSYMIPLCGIECFETVELLKGLLAYNPEARLKLDDALVLTDRIINSLTRVADEPNQLVPDLEVSPQAPAREPEVYRWKFAVMQRGDRFTLKQDPGCQIPILHLTADEKRVKAIEMKHIRSTIGNIPIDVIKSHPMSAGTYTGKPYLSKRKPTKIDQVVPEVEVKHEEMRTFVRIAEGEPTPETDPTPETNPTSQINLTSQGNSTYQVSHTSSSNPTSSDNTIISEDTLLESHSNPILPESHLNADDTSATIPAKRRRVLRSSSPKRDL